MSLPPAPITLLLQRSREGNKEAIDHLIPLVYEQLHKLASRCLYSEPQGRTMRSTELVHEAYLRLVGCEVPWNDRMHFYAVAARVMRRILIDSARARNRGKRGGEFEKVPLDQGLEVGVPAPHGLLVLHDALDRLAARDQRKSDIIELLVFGGLTYDEAAGSLAISPATLHRELKLAKAWLYKECISARQAGDTA